MKNDQSVVDRYLPSVNDRETAERKLAQYFASFGINAVAERERLVDPFIRRATQFWRGHHGVDFASLALDEAETVLGIWFSDVFELDYQDDPRSTMTGRAAFLMCDGPRRFAGLFLLPVSELPEAFLIAMRSHAPVALPPSDHGDMHHQPYETWSIRHLFAMALPLDKPLTQIFGDLVRRDGRALSLIPWRNTGPT